MSDDRALLDAIEAIRQMVPNIQTTIANIATLTEKVANIEGNSSKQFDMLLGMQKAEKAAEEYRQKMRRDRWKLVLGFLAVLVTQIATVLVGIYKR